MKKLQRFWVRFNDPRCGGIRLSLRANNCLINLFLIPLDPVQFGLHFKCETRTFMQQIYDPVWGGEEHVQFNDSRARIGYPRSLCQMTDRPPLPQHLMTSCRRRRSLLRAKQLLREKITIRSPEDLLCLHGREVL